jgi:hypothetical protein
VTWFSGRFGALQGHVATVNVGDTAEGRGVARSSFVPCYPEGILVVCRSVELCTRAVRVKVSFHKGP